MTFEFLETDDLIVMFMWIIIKRGDSQRNYPVTMVHIWWTKSSNRIDPRNHCAYHPRSGGTVERESGPVENNVYGTTSQGNCRYSPRKGNSTIHGLLSKTCLEFTKVVGIIPSPVDHSKVAKSATQTHASHCKRAPSPTTKVTSDPTPLAVTPHWNQGEVQVTHPYTHNHVRTRPKRLSLAWREMGPESTSFRMDASPGPLSDGIDSVMEV